MPGRDKPIWRLPQLEPWLKQPAGRNVIDQPSYGDLKLNPMWDPLRGDPRFDSLIERLAPSNDRAYVHNAGDGR